MDEKIKLSLLSHTDSNLVLNEELIQDLWSQYGKLIRVKLDNGSLIVKQINFPNQKDHPKGWNSDLSHERKVKSYQVEMNWYKEYNHIIQGAHSPKYISSQTCNNTIYLILEDLKEKGFEPKVTLNWKQIKLCIKWMALFHAKYLGISPKGLWTVGTYWHLDTRPDELLALKNSDLKKAAPLINQKLNASQFQTIVHGDAKLANFLFNASEVSAVDFQYVGGGVGVKDLAYFLSSIYNESELQNSEQLCVDYYFNKLIGSIKVHHPQVNSSLLEKEWRDLYKYACCDFYRFLEGWSPGHHKLNSYSQKVIKKVLQCI